MRVLVGALGVIGLTLWVALPVAGFFWLAQTAAQKPLEEAQRVWVHPVAAEGELKTEVGIGIEWAQSPSLLAPAWSGTVQTTAIGPGSPIGHGTEVATIDGLRRLAWQTAVPFSKTLAVGDRGTEVSQLTAALRSLGFDAPQSDRFSWSTLVSVREYAKAIGETRPDLITEFDPAWVIFLRAPTVAGTVELVPGAVAPAQGEVIAEGDRVIAKAVFIGVDQVETLNEEGSSEATLEQLAPSSARVSIPVEETVSIAGAGLEVVGEDRSEVGPSSFQTLKEAVAADVRGTVATRGITAPEGTWRIPSAGVYLDPGGVTCSLVREADGKERTVRADVVASAESDVVVRSEMKVTDEVALYVVTSEESCESG